MALSVKPVKKKVVQHIVKDVCEPLKSLHELENWEPDGIPHITLPLMPTLKRNKLAPKTLVCHDMKGGYLEDKFVNGVFEKDCFSLIHWQYIDVFVYFSHEFITIPPCSWINAAHTNGTPILGTVITEHVIGASICMQLFANQASTSDYCNSLVHIAMSQGFDGWLINIENKTQREEVYYIMEFVDLLTRRMHHAVPGSLVIWYDSIVEDGSLQWQNCLNDRNKNFFDCCDGIFLNYNWKNEHLERTVRLAGSRVADVYAGIDVFGRGTLGGGGFNVEEPARIARSLGLSIAIFAPGWVYENFDNKDCLKNSMKFWDSILYLCYPPCCVKLPFATCFCPGFGSRVFRKGQAVSQRAWHNLGLQNIQPMYNVEAGVELCTTDAYSGGGCLKLVKKNPKAIFESFRIFDTHMKIDRSLAIFYTFKVIGGDPDVQLEMVFSVSTFDKTYTVHMTDPDRMGDAESDIHQLVDFLRSRYLDQCFLHLTETCDEEDNQWMERCYIMEENEFKNQHIENINFKVFGKTTAEVIIGSVQILHRNQSMEFYLHGKVEPYQKDNDWWMKCILRWTRPKDVEHFDLHYKLHQSPDTYLGTTNQDFMHVDIYLGQSKAKNIFFYLHVRKADHLLDELKELDLSIPER